MTWAGIKASGSGKVSYRLMIEGWPYEFVTFHEITHSTNADGRTVLPGLRYDGLALRERVIMQEAAIEADGITFRVVPMDSRELTMLAFSFYPEPAGLLLTGIDGTEATTVALSSSLPNGTVFHIGTEAIRKVDSTHHTRHVWDTQAQAHPIESSNGSPLPAYAYLWPPAMEGRRAYLYAYGTGDNYAGDGTCIWRGIVATPPTLDSDGVTWLIACHPITKIMAQQLAGFIREAHPVFITHHEEASVYMELSAGTPVANRYVGRDTELTLIYNINTLLIDLLTRASLTGVASALELITTANGWAIHLRTTVSWPADAFVFKFASPLLGTFRSKYKWVDGNGAELDGGTITFLQASTDYYGYLESGTLDEWQKPIEYKYTGAPAFPLGAAFALAKDVTEFYIPTLDTAFKPWRVYVDTDMTGTDLVHISGTYSPTGIFPVYATGGGTSEPYWIDLADYSVTPAKTLPQFSVTNIPPELPITQKLALGAGFFGVLDANTKIIALRQYATAARIHQFIDGLIIQGIFANNGDTPFVTLADFADWDTGADSNDPIQTYRNYWFAKPKSLEEVLQAELKFQNCFMRFEADGRIGIKPLPSFTNTASVDAAHAIDGSGIITPADGYGAWPGWEPQKDGLITTVEVKQDYDPFEDAWKGKTAIFQQPSAVAIHKTRGKVQATIAPYSGGPPTYGRDTFDLFFRIANAFLASFAREYAVVRVKVSFKHFDVLCGDVVSLTHRLIPAGDGTRGIVARRGICIERRWNLDPALPDHGELAIYIPREAEHGYAPSAFITAKTNTSGNTWSITCGTSFLGVLNIVWSTNGDGKVLQHFVNGDSVRVVLFNSTSASAVTGTISSVDAAAGTCVVAFDSTWTPGSSGWVLEYQVDTLLAAHSSAHQRLYCYVADTNFLLPGGAFTRVFA